MLESLIKLRKAAIPVIILIVAHASLGRQELIVESQAVWAQTSAALAPNSLPEQQNPAGPLPNASASQSVTTPHSHPLSDSSGENKSKTTIYPGGGFRLESQKLDKETPGKKDFVDSGVKVQMNLTGSMCMACLSDFKRKLAELPGIASVKIEYPGDFSNFGQSYALLSLTLDEGQIAVPDLTVFIQEQGYQPYKIIRKESR